MTPRRPEMRATYDAMLFSPGRAFATILSYGLLFFLVDQSAHLGMYLLNRPFTADEWEAYRRSPEAVRKRKLGELHAEPEVLGAEAGGYAGSPFYKLCVERAEGWTP